MPTEWLCEVHGAKTKSVGHLGNSCLYTEPTVTFLCSLQPYNFSGPTPDGFRPQLPMICFYHHFSFLLSLVSVLSSDLFIAGFRLKICQSHLSHACYMPLPTDTPLDLVTPVPVAARSKAPRLLGLGDRIPPGGMDVLCEYCVLSGIRHCEGPIPRMEQSYRVSGCDLLASTMGRPRSHWGCCAWREDCMYQKYESWLLSLYISGHPLSLSPT